jgi:hypothetical protein
MNRHAKKIKFRLNIERVYCMEQEVVTFNTLDAEKFS